MSFFLCSTRAPLRFSRSQKRDRQLQPQGVPHQWAGSPRKVVQIQAILFASSAVSFLPALVGVLGKLWLSHYKSSEMTGSTIERNRNRQQKLDATWSLFGYGFSRYLWDIDTTIALVVTSVISLGAIFYLFVSISGAATQDCLCPTLISHLLRCLMSSGARLVTGVRTIPECDRFFRLLVFVNFADPILVHTVRELPKRW